jgi:hypothetical protein
VVTKLVKWYAKALVRSLPLFILFVFIAIIIDVAVYRTYYGNVRINMFEISPYLTSILPFMYKFNTPELYRLFIALYILSVTAICLILMYIIKFFAFSIRAIHMKVHDKIIY